MEKVEEMIPMVQAGTTAIRVRVRVKVKAKEAKVIGSTRE